MKLSWIAQPSVLKEIRTRKKSEFSIKIASFPHTFIHTKNRVIFHHTRKIFSCEITRDAFFTRKINRVIFHHTRKNRVISHERFLECSSCHWYDESFSIK